MTHDEYTFQQALARARASAAAELAAHAAGLVPAQSRDIRETLDRQEREHMWRVLGLQA